MKQKYFQERILAEVEKLLNLQLIQTSIPPQGMGSEVFSGVDAAGGEYAIKYSPWGLGGDAAALQLLRENRVDVPLPAVVGSFEFEDGQVLVMEKIDFPLLESVPAEKMGGCIPSMVRHLRKIHEVQSSRAGLLADAASSASWKDILLAKFTGKDPGLDWNEIACRKGIDSALVQEAVGKIIKKIENAKFPSGPHSLLHTDFNQRNLFVDPASAEIRAIIDWGEAMFGDPVYDFARVRMLIWHFGLSQETLEEYYRLLSFSPEEKEREELYWLSRVIEYLAYYSEERNDFNAGRIRMHQDFLRAYEW